jgi:SRSO17 transposase
MKMLAHIPEKSERLFKVLGINEKSVSELDKFIMSFLLSFIDCFMTDEHLSNAYLYMKGLLSNLPRKNCQAIALKYGKLSDVSNLHHFMSTANWSHLEMIKVHIQNALEILSNEGEWMLTIDGTDMPKKGKNSPGVFRQYCGALGKVDNCIATICVGWTSKFSHGLFNERIYLPEEWLSDDYAERRKKSGIQNISFKTKNMLALDLINEIIAAGAMPKWIGGDGAFGHDTVLLDSLPIETYYFMNVHKTDTFYTKYPDLKLPAYSGRGRKPSVPKANEAPVKVEQIVENSDIPWNKTTFGIGAEGVIEGYDKLIRVVDIRNGQPNNYVWIYARKLTNNEKRYFISNGPEDTTIDKFRELATMRWPIEQCFQECKSLLGLDQFVGRSWIGLHRHMSLVFVLHFFLGLMVKKFHLKYDQFSDFGREMYRIIFEGSDEYNSPNEYISNESIDELGSNGDADSDSQSNNVSVVDADGADSDSQSNNVSDVDADGADSDSQSNNVSVVDAANADGIGDDPISQSNSVSVADSIGGNPTLIEKRKSITVPILTLNNFCLLIQACFEYTEKSVKRAIMVVGVHIDNYHKKLKNAYNRYKYKIKTSYDKVAPI